MSKYSRSRGLKDVLAFLASHLKRHGIGPTATEIQRQFEWRSRTSVVQAMRQLTREGLVEKVPGTKFQFRRVISDGRLDKGFARIRLFRIEKGESLDTRRTPHESFWIDRRMFGVSKRRNPILVRFDEPPPNPFALHAGHAVLVFPWEGMKGGGRAWVLATVDGQTGIYWSFRSGGYTFLRRQPGREDCRDIEVPNLAIHGKILSAIFADTRSKGTNPSQQTRQTRSNSSEDA